MPGHRFMLGRKPQSRSTGGRSTDALYLGARPTTRPKDVRIWVEGDVALVTRQYAIQATLRGREIGACGNETMG